MVGAKQDRLITPLHFLDAAVVVQLLDDRLCFLLVIAKFPKCNGFASPLVRPKPFFPAICVVFDDGVGGVEDRVRGAIVLLELNNGDLGEVLLEFQ